MIFNPLRSPRIARLAIIGSSIAVALLVGIHPAEPGGNAGVGATITVTPGTAATTPGRAPVLFLEVRGEPELLAERLAEISIPIRIRFAGMGWALVEVSEADRTPFQALWPTARVLMRADSPVELFSVQESELTARGRAECDRHTLLLAAGEDVRLLALPARTKSAVETGARGGLGLIPTALHLEAAHALPLPESISPRALGPLPRAERANPYRLSRLADPIARARAIDLAGQVDSSRIMRIVRDLAPGPSTSRFSCRDEVNIAGQYLLDTLQSIFSGPADDVFPHPFTIQCNQVPVELFNVIARRPGQRPGSGRYILSAHYDATGSFTPGGWNGAVDPAPGADDNASGVACAIEAARILLQATYDFDLEVALFSGEELGLIGSRAYTDDSLSAVDEVLGVINLDMVGYNPRAADSLNAITNYTSEWLADLILEGESVLPGEHGLREFDKVVRPAFGRSDHGPFWAHGQSALLLIENIDIERHNPTYHRTSDTAEVLAAVEGGDQMRRVTEAVVATLGQFAISAVPEPSFTMPATGVVLYLPDGRDLVDAVAGQLAHVRTRVINVGAADVSSVDVHAALRLGGSIVAEGDTSFGDWGSGVWHQIVLPWTPEEEDIGQQVLQADLVLRRQGNTLATLSGSVSFDVIPFVSPFIAPNPVRGSLAAGRLRLDPLVPLSAEADMRCHLLDAVGNTVGRYEGRVVQGELIPLDRIAETPAGLPSGVYVLLIELRVPGQGTLVGSHRLIFGYMR